ncbi:hypothetical protein [Wolbachia endosymbiont of Ctenocephalides felis wCfeT]|uniref:hypothetical protein n=1 Tax=Wolbachia endosymbiont of Ctenocephalides felis wCfeT TaxID=2732593 RepID=UPI001446F6F4|nr:hypothetical protein [Wolbachia endosymbiont of Ctenocephalides felis wCfeT]
MTKNPAITLAAKAKEFSFHKLRAEKSNEQAKSGVTMSLDFHRMSFIINGKKIDKNLITAFKEGAQHYKSGLFKSELFNSNDIYSDETFNNSETREIDTDYGKAFVASVLENLEKELISDELTKLWNNHCKNSETADYQKTDSFKKEFEEFYNAGKSYAHLLPAEKDEVKYDRFLAKEIFKQMFRYAGAEVPSDAILEELITNCNQAGYDAAPAIHTQFALGEPFIVTSPEKVIYIDCTNQNNVRIRSDMRIPICSVKNQVIHKICDLPHSLEFTLEHQDDENLITYTDGKLLLTIPEELKNYKYNGQSLFDIITEYFKTLCEKLGFKFEAEIQTEIELDLGAPIKVSRYLDGTISTIGSEANKDFINLLEKNLEDRLLKSGVKKEDIDAYVEVKVPTVIDLLSNYAKLEDTEENKELLIKEVTDNLGLSSHDHISHGNSSPFALKFLPSLVKGTINYDHAKFVANTFTKLIIEGKSEIYEKQGAINAIDAINQKVDKKIVEQEEKITNKHGTDKWADKIKEQRLSMGSHSLSIEM